MSGLPTMRKSWRKPYFLSRNAHFADVPSTDHSLSMGNFRGIFSLSKGWPLFLAISVCIVLEGRLSLHGCVCDRILFSLNKEFFRYCEENSFWGKKIVFWKFPFFLESFGLALLVPYTLL